MIAMSQTAFWPFPHMLGLPLPFEPLQQSSLLYAMWHTVILATGAIIMVGVLRQGFYNNELFRFGRSPISIAVSGDSGVGKDTLAAGLISVFGRESVAHLSGDDYHFWDRKGAMWKAVTHLNPRANNLKQLYADINALLDRKDIWYRRYRHSDGRFSHPVLMRSKEICIVSGLHTLLQNSLCARFDLRIFMEMDEELRRFFKCKRDMRERGHSREQVDSAFEFRRKDSIRYIHPQADRADLVIRLGALNKDTLDPERPGEVPSLYLTVKLRGALYYEELVRQLMAFCGLQVDVDFSEDLETVIMRIEGDVNEEDIALIVRQNFPEIQELLAVEPGWKPGVQGIMQLVTIFHLMQSLRGSRL